MNRGTIGITPRPTRLADESYLEFITSFRRLAIQEMFPKVAEHGEAALAKALETGEIEAPPEGDAVKLADIREVFGKNPVTPTFQRFVRTARVQHALDSRVMVEQAVKGMLPKTKLGRAMAKKLKVYRGAEHPHVAQNPEPLTLQG